jgi:hypothetical protein
MNLITDGSKIVDKLISELERQNAYLCETKALIQTQNSLLAKLIDTVNRNG